MVLCSDEDWKLVDFDSARHIGQDCTLTTVDYTAPEVAIGSLRRETTKARPEIDVFALGMLLYYMAARNVYWKTETGAVDNNQKLKMLASENELVISNSMVQSEELRNIIRSKDFMRWTWVFTMLYIFC